MFASIAWYFTITCNIWTIISQGQQDSHLEDKVVFGEQSIVTHLDLIAVKGALDRLVLK